MDNEVRPLDAVYQDAESSFAGLMAAIEQAGKNTGARPSWTRVLFWYATVHADEHDVVADSRVIANSWILECRPRLVQYANSHWKTFRVLTFRERYDENGGSAAPWARLHVEIIKELASGRPARTIGQVLVFPHHRGND